MSNDLLKISLNQGKQFKSYQNKIKQSVLKSKRHLKNNVNFKLKEGFVSGEQEIMVRSPDEGYTEILQPQINTTKRNNTVNQNELDELNTLQSKFNDLMQQYNAIQKTIGDSSLATINRVSSNNPYLNKNIRFSNGTICYVTNEGIARPYGSLDVFINTEGKNGCPSSNDMINIDFSFTPYDYMGATIPTSPTLIVGEYMTAGKSCGVEGKNVYASTLVNNPSSSYVGCYNDKPMDVSTIDDSQRAMIWNPSAVGYTTYDKCQQYALNNGYQYFGMQNYQPDGTAGCLVSNDIDKTKSYGDGSLQIDTMTAIWSSNTNIGGSRMALSADTGINVLNGNTTVYVSNFNGIMFYSDCGFSGQNTNAALGQHNVSDIGFPNDALSSLIVPESFGIVLFRDDIGTEPSLSLGPGQYPCLVDNGWNDIVTSYTAYFTGNCYLLLQDDGNVIISKGNPGSDYNVIWSTGTNGRQMGPNPLWTAEKGKFGRNYIQFGEGLNPGEWIGSTNGSTKLIMQTDGNLVLYTSTVRQGCVTGSDNRSSGTSWVNAVYKLDNMGDKSALGKVGYITADSKLKEYPSSMLGVSNSYKIIEGADSAGNDIASWNGISQEDCQTECNSNADCYGYAYRATDQMCWIKNQNMYPKGNITNYPGSNLGIRKPSLKNPPTCNNEITDVDTIRYADYIQSDAMTPETQCNASLVSQSDQANFDNIKNQLVILGQDIASKMQNLYNQDAQIYKKLNTNEVQFKKDVEKYNNINMQIRQELELQSNNNIEGMINMNDINGMLSNTDIIVLEENYKYIFWGVLAIGIVTITVNLMNKNK